MPHHWTTSGLETSILDQNNKLAQDNNRFIYMMMTMTNIIKRKYLEMDGERQETFATVKISYFYGMEDVLKIANVEMIEINFHSHNV